ncbi:MAG: geranylgeranylglycerol-phosphate geranylgeranyltransferase [Sphingobacteriales bacterium]|nr:geranylgeranylglycerol-phosphate geranylgeranyltransferase [Sphingobacteriales bacterium]
MNYLKLIRPLNLMMIVLTMYLFRICIVAATPYKFFYIEPVLSGTEFLLLVLTTIFIAAGGYVVNDIFDSDIDAVNRSHKVIVGESVSEDAAYKFYTILCGLGIACTLVLALLTKNYRLSSIPVVIMVLLNFYAHTFKKQLIVGNLIIALCTSFTVFIIALFESTDNPDMTANERYVHSGIAIAATVYGLFAFLTTFLREIVKDIEDQAGDEQYGCKSIPIVFGHTGAKISAFVISILLLVLLASFVWFFPGLEKKNIAYFVLFLLIIPVFLINFLIFRAKYVRNYHLISNLIKVFMVIGISTMLYFYSGIGPYVFVQYANFLKKLV